MLRRAALERSARPVARADMRELNLECSSASELDDARPRRGRHRCACRFWAERRVVVVRGCASELRARPRRALLGGRGGGSRREHALLEDLVLAGPKAKPEPLRQRSPDARRCASTRPVTPDARARFVRETLERFGVKAEPRAIAALADSDARPRPRSATTSRSSRSRAKITSPTLERETLRSRTRRPAITRGALAEGRAAEALAIAFELFANDPRGAAVPLCQRPRDRLGLVVGTGPSAAASLPAAAPLARARRCAVARRLGERRAATVSSAPCAASSGRHRARIDDPRAMIELLPPTAAGPVEAR